MRINVCNYLTVLFIAFISVLSFSSCTTEKNYDNSVYGPEIITRPFTIYANAWKWNNIYHRYECTVELEENELDYDLYKYGTIVGTVYVNEKTGNGDETYEVQKNLPFIQTYLDLEYPYSEIISFDVFYGGTSSVTFYIQATDGTTQSPYLMDYTFKVAFIRDTEG